MTDPHLWTGEEVGQWLRRAKFDHLVELLCVQHRIDGTALLLLSEQDLRTPPLQLQSLGDIKRLAAAIDDLRRNSVQPQNGQINRSESSVEEFSTEFLIAEVESADTKNKSLLKTALALVYFGISIMMTSLVMVVVHDRVPDSKTYPPLPDIVLDNVPLIPWAFDVCEVLLCFLGFVWFLVVLFHKQRLVLMRRFFSLISTVFLLRCVTMMITSLSVPGVHLECKATMRDSGWWDKFLRAREIWSGLGMSLLNVRSCGDYMFSGHTTMVTMFNHFITEYTPGDWNILHTTSWVCNLFAIFFILAAHEHYSIDVFVAFYISSRLFLYYHSLAYHAPSISAADSRTRIWFPLFWFFESGGQVGRVKNEYEWPLPSLASICNYINGSALIQSSIMSFEKHRLVYKTRALRWHRMFLGRKQDANDSKAD